jgi:hypothetical protein
MLEDAGIEKTDQLFRTIALSRKSRALGIAVLPA